MYTIIIAAAISRNIHGFGRGRRGAVLASGLRESSVDCFSICHLWEYTILRSWQVAAGIVGHFRSSRKGTVEVYQVRPNAAGPQSEAGGCHWQAAPTIVPL